MRRLASIYPCCDAAVLIYVNFERQPPKARADRVRQRSPRQRVWGLLAPDDQPATNLTSMLEDGLATGAPAFASTSRLNRSGPDSFGGVKHALSTPFSVRGGHSAWIVRR